jgi:hypothetical protein
VGSWVTQGRSDEPGGRKREDHTPPAEAERGDRRDYSDREALDLGAMLTLSRKLRSSPAQKTNSAERR